MRLEGRLELVVVHRLQLVAADDRGVTGDDAHPPGDGLGGQAVVARHHHDADAGAAALVHGVGHLGTGRVEHADEAEKDEVVLGLVLGRMGAGHGPASNRQHAQGLPREGVVGLGDLRPQLVIEADDLALPHR